MSGRKGLAGALAVLMLVAGIMIMPEKANAVETTMPETVYYNEELKIADYWTTKTAPVEEGYVFGGWYTKTTEGEEITYTALTEADLTGKELSTLTGVCAKFVPAYVLSVKAQLEKATEENDGKNAETTYMRVITALDSNEYQKVNFEIWYNNTIEDTTVPDITKVYSSITNADGTLSPQTEFGEAANYFGVLKLTDIWDDNYSKIIYVRPSWTTMDGTKVEGLGKYVRVEDGFQSYRYISVPVNLLQGEEMAAGTLEMSYDSDTLKFVSFDEGRLLPEMNYYVDETTGTIKFVGNLEGTQDSDGNLVNETPDGIYANVRFRRKTADELAEGVTISDNQHWDFAMNNESFCDWAEDMADVIAWDARY